MFSSYFHERRQMVIQGEKTSTTLPNTIDVQQRTIFGPILFSVDFRYILKTFKLSLIRR